MSQVMNAAFYPRINMISFIFLKISGSKNRLGWEVVRLHVVGCILGSNLIDARIYTLCHMTQEAECIPPLLGFEYKSTQLELVIKESISNKSVPSLGLKKPLEFLFLLTWSCNCQACTTFLFQEEKERQVEQSLTATASPSLYQPTTRWASKPS